MSLDPSFSLVVLWFIHTMYGHHLRDSIRLLFQEVNATLARRRDPGAVNFVFGVFLVMMIGIVFIASEASSYIRDFFLREAFDAASEFGKLAILAFLIMFLGIFFIWSLTLITKYRR